MIVAGQEYRVRGKRGRFIAVRPIDERGWWMKGPNHRLHAYETEKIVTLKGKPIG